MLIGIFLLLLHIQLDQDDVTAQSVADSGRCADFGETPDERVAPSTLIAPGAAPLLTFRFYEGKQHNRYGNQDLLLDDAGH